VKYSGRHDKVLTTYKLVEISDCGYYGYSNSTLFNIKLDSTFFNNETTKNELTDIECDTKQIRALCHP